MALFAVPAVAQVKTVPQTAQQVQLSFSPLVKKAGPAVVNIYARRIVRQRVNPFLSDPFFQRFFDMRGFGGGMVREKVENALGSGVIVDPAGLIVTNVHVVKDAQEIVVVLSTGHEFEARLVLSDESTDLAVLKIEPGARQLHALEMADSDALEVGDMVLAIGNPFGVGQTVTAGIVSAVARTGVGASDYSYYIQTDAAINPGNSGGALIDMQGRLVGVNSSIYTRDGGSLGIGFAVPSVMVKTVLQAARTGARVQRVWAGLSGQPVTADVADSLGLPAPAGAITNVVHPQSPAGKAGVKVGDVILAINGREVRDPAALKFRLGTAAIGETVTLTIFRNGKTFDVSFKAEPPPEVPKRDETKLQGASPFSGATVANISPAVAEELGGLDAVSGVVIVKVDGGYAARLGMRPGDVIVSVNGEKAATTADMRRITDKRASYWNITLMRDGRTINLTVQG